MKKSLDPPNETALTAIVSLQNSAPLVAPETAKPSVTVPTRYLNYTQIKTMTGLSKTTLWRLERRGDFPSRIRLGPRTLVWEEQAVLRWIASRPRGMNSSMVSREDS